MTEKETRRPLLAVVCANRHELSHPHVLIQAPMYINKLFFFKKKNGQNPVITVKCGAAGTFIHENTKQHSHLEDDLAISWKIKL